MKVKPVLDEYELPRIESISTVEHRAVVEHRVPGGLGGVLQDLGAAPMRVEISGSLYGDETRDGFLDAIRARFQEGAPLTFAADITTASQVQYVVITDLRCREVAGDPNAFHYHLVLCESLPPPPPPDPLAGIETDLLDEAAAIAGDIAGAASLLDALGSVPDVGNPVAPLGRSLDEVRGLTSGLGQVGQQLSDLFGSRE